MEKQKIIRFVESLIILPIATMSLPYSGLEKSVDIAQAPQVVFSQKENIETLGIMAFNNAMDSRELTREARAEAIDTYFSKRDMPLAGHGMKMVLEAEKNDLDWRLLPAIAVRESTGGKHACKRVPNSFFGWGSCKIGFESVDKAIETVAWNLGGNNPNTARYYADKSTLAILEAYNPRTVVARYPEQVMAIMDAIGDKDLEVIVTETENS